MMFFILSLLLCLLTTVLSHDQQALKFGDDLTSYIMISPDMTPLEEAVSVCSWIKQLSPTSRNGVVMHYKTVGVHDAITIADNLYWAYLTQSHTSHSPTPPQSEWYHVCLTWSFSSRTNTLYYNGAQIGTATTPSGLKFSVAEGSIVLGQYHNTYKMRASFSGTGTQFTFGGEMSKMNIFKRTLSAEEVAKMYNSGICSDYEDSLQDDIHLSWETLLSDETQKHGNVRPIDLSCPDHTHEPPTENATTVGPTEESTGCADRWAILRLPDFYNKEVETELLQDLRDRWELLAEFMGHEVDNVLIAHLLKHHCDTEISATQESPEEAENDTEDTDTCPQRWAILRTSDFHNQEVTSDMIKDLRGRWELLAEFSGHVIDDALIAHLEKHHCTCNSES